MKYLFVGGDSDGMRIDVTGNPMEIRLPCRGFAAVDANPGTTCDASTVIQSYRRIELCDGAGNYVVYMNGNVAQPIRMLIEGYAGAVTT